MRNFTLALFFILWFSQLHANSTFPLSISLRWKNTADTIHINEKTFERWHFEGAIFGEAAPTLPLYTNQFKVNTAGTLRVEVVSARFESFERQATPDDTLLGEQLNFFAAVTGGRDGYTGKLAFVPIIRRGGNYERLVEAELRITHETTLTITKRDPNNTKVSALSDSDSYKFATSGEGVYKLTYDFLKNKLAISDLDNIDPRNIKIYGNGGGMLPFAANADRIDDVAENPIVIVGEDDGKFDSGDYILFYGEGPDKWSYDAIAQEFNMEKNIFDTRNYYFIKTNSERGKRIQNQTNLTITNYTSTAFNDFARFEQDKVNLLYYFGTQQGLAQGSGQKWYGDLFKGTREYEYKNLFSFPNVLADQPAKIKTEMALRALQPSRFNIIINGQTFNSTSVSGPNSFTDNEGNYAAISSMNTSLSLTSGDLNFVVRYNNPGGSGDGSEGWLDFIQMNVRRKLTMTGSQMDFRDVTTLQYPATTFQLDNVNGNLLIWDISNPLVPKNQEFTLNGNTLNFGINTSTLKTFIAFDKTQGFLEPAAVGKVAKQNLHGTENVDMVVVYHPDFDAEAKRLAEHRAKHSGLTVQIIRLDQLYNEFASGKTDPTAIRDFAKMLYERSPKFKYLLLFGDGSFDQRNIYGLGNNFVPVYEKEDMNPIESFPSDDYFGILNSTSSSNLLLNDVDIAIGRFPVKTLEEAQSAVNKVINYDTNQEALGDWRNQLVFVGDDQDSGAHTQDANEIADLIGSQNRFMNLNKIYLDAFPQVAASGGNRFPQAKAELNRAIFKGALAITYLGHGGEKGWAQERVLEISDVVNWENGNRLPLFMTATCSFTGYDNPAFTTAGEEAFLNVKGGAIALMTTVRAVYATENAALTRAALQQLFTRENGKYLPIGEVLRKSKNSFTNNFTVTNSRKFSLIGDPSLVLAIPQYGVRTTKVNTKDAAVSSTDTIRALQKVTVEGIVTDLNGQQLTGFNGVVYPTVFDKANTVVTLGQDADSPKYPFKVQRNIIFKGRASANNGAFKFTFVVPKDINYEFGLGKVSYYADDESRMTDATGTYEQIIIGGTDANAVADDKGPNVEVFMNSEDFVFGSMTNANPTLLVKLRDDNGINVVGNSIGHDLEGTLDNDTQNSYLLNDFYESELDDYTQGRVRYPLYKLAEGRHEVKVIAWDIANNASQGYTEFIVANSGKVALSHVLNYPNPFTDRTCFQFDHNLANQQMDVLIQIFTISGRLVKTLEQNMLSDGTIRRDDCIEWDGHDDYGDRLARGVYLYKVKVRAGSTGIDNLKGESEFEKLVILK